MARAQLKSPLTDEHARRIAAAIAKGRPPARAADLELYLETNPREIFAAFEGAARHMPPAGNNAELAFGYLFLLQLLLERIRYRLDEGHADAAQLVADFQSEVAARAEAGRVDGRLLVCVGGALHEANIPAAPQLAAASKKLYARASGDVSLPDDLDAALAGIVEACGSDPFAVIGSLSEAGHTLPDEARAALGTALAHGRAADARAAAVLLLLDPNAVVRSAVAGALHDIADSLSPTELRRLIAIRNWRPEIERDGVDALIRKMRAAGVSCAQWPKGEAETIRATAIDGAGAQGFLLISSAARKKRLSSILIKGRIADAWSGEPEPARRIEASIASAGAPMLPVPRSYLDRTVEHALALSVEKGDIPPVGLLQVAETIGGADWQPVRMETGEILAALVQQIPTAMCRAATREELLRRSGQLTDLQGVAQSWFADDPQIVRLVRDSRGVKPSKLVDYLLQSGIARDRAKWTDLFVRTALWMRGAPAELDLCWRELAIVAKALADGREMTEIGLMREIALRSISAARDVASL